MTTKLECFLPFLATCHDFLSPLSPGPWFNIMMTSYQYRKSHCGDKMIFWPSYLHNGISHTGKITSLYWNGFLTMSFKMADEISTSLMAVWVLHLYVLNLSEGAKRYTYILCYSSTLAGCPTTSFFPIISFFLLFFTLLPIFSFFLLKPPINSSFLRNAKKQKEKCTSKNMLLPHNMCIMIIACAYK